MSILWGIVWQDEATLTYWKHYFCKPYPTTGQFFKTLSHISRKTEKQDKQHSTVQSNIKTKYSTQLLNPRLNHQENPHLAQMLSSLGLPLAAWLKGKPPTPTADPGHSFLSEAQFPQMSAAPWETRR